MIWLLLALALWLFGPHIYFEIHARCLVRSCQRKGHELSSWPAGGGMETGRMDVWCSDCERHASTYFFAPKATCFGEVRYQ